MKKKILLFGIISMLIFMLFLLTGCGKNESNKSEEINNDNLLIQPENVELNVNDLVEGKIVYNKNNVIIKVTKIANFKNEYEIFCSVVNSNDYPISIYGINENNVGNAVRINDVLMDNTKNDGNTFSLNRQYFEIGESESTLLNIRKQDCANSGINSINKISFGIKITILNDDKTNLDADIVTLK